MARNKVSAARWAAFEILLKLDEGAFSSILLADAESRLEPLDRSLCHELVLGVLRWRLKLDSVIEHYANRKVATLDGPVLNALRLGLYQLRYLTRIPASAAVDESVKLVHSAGLSSARTLVNAILRRATREPDYDPVAHIDDPISRIALETSHPSWLIERWVNSSGLEEAKAFATANNEAAQVSFRIVRSQTSDSEVMAKLHAAGIAVAASRIASGAWRVSGAAQLLRELVDSGAIYLQDQASQLVAETVGASAGECILDLCAAPGGKATLIADGEPRAFVVAGDVSSRRLATIAKTVARQALKNITLTTLDATKPLPFAPNSFDRVLVDAPCSGTGTLRQNPEIRWRISPGDIRRLASQQLQFLVNAASVVKSGGVLVYSTCSIENEENENVVAQFLEKCRNYQQITLRHESVQSTSSGALRTWPQHDGADGFFVAALQKQSD